MLDKDRLDLAAKKVGVKINYDSIAAGIYIENKKEITFKKLDEFIDIFEDKEGE